VEVIILLIRVIRFIGQAITLLVIVQVVLSYFMSPYHPVRQTIDRVVEPMLAPIRRVVPPVGMLDFSPFVLLILIQILISVVTNFLLTLI
jgi:YggT family protein